MAVPHTFHNLSRKSVSFLFFVMHVFEDIFSNSRLSRIERLVIGIGKIKLASGLN
jgi:hypothetical protein